MPDRSTPDCLPPPANPQAVAQRLPVGSCDAHIHVIGSSSTYPLDAGRGYTPHEATLASYRDFMSALGIERAVLVQPSFYGVDNSAMLDALREGGDAFRGVVVPSPSVTDQEIESMHALGVRGLRLNLVNPQVLGVQDAIDLCKRVHGLGWHLQVQFDLAKGDIRQLQSLRKSIAVPLVIDHMGRLDPDTTDHPVLGMLGDGECWIKLSAPYRLSRVSAPYADLQSLVRKLLETNPSRLLWGSDWPHTEQQTHMPTADEIGGWLFSSVPDADVRRAICVDNPARLYQFSTGSTA